MLELCKDRLPLLMDPDSPPPQIWHTRRVQFNGLPEEPGYPTAEEIIGTLHTQPGNPITVGDIESDSTALLKSGVCVFVLVTQLNTVELTTSTCSFSSFVHLSPIHVYIYIHTYTTIHIHTYIHHHIHTFIHHVYINSIPGIFGSVRPQVKPALPTESPAFLLDDGRVRAVSPFSIIEFIVTERQLPQLESFSVRVDASVESPQLRGVCGGVWKGVWWGLEECVGECVGYLCAEGVAEFCC